MNIDPEQRISARKAVSDNVRLGVDLNGHIVFIGPGRLNAIRDYRAVTKCSLSEAKEIVERTIVELFGVGFVEFVARISFGAGETYGMGKRPDIVGPWQRRLYALRTELESLDRPKLLGFAADARLTPEECRDKGRHWLIEEIVARSVVYPDVLPA